VGRCRIRADSLKPRGITIFRGRWQQQNTAVGRRRACASGFTSPTFLRIPGPLFASPHALASRCTLSSPPASRPLTARSVAQAWIISTMSQFYGMRVGKHSRPGEAANERGLFCLRHTRRNPTSTTRFFRPTFFCSAANQRVCRRRCTRPPTRGSSFQCRAAGVRSMSRSPRRWQLAKHCDSYGKDKHEAGEGHSHAPGRYPSPASLAGAGRLSPRAKSPRQTEATSHSPVPHIRKLYRKNGKILPRVWNLWSVRMKLRKLSRIQLQRACESAGIRLLGCLDHLRRQRASVYNSRYA
jgi:hypothetical protein